MVSAARDRWAQWLLERRFGGVDPERKKAFVDYLIPVRDRVLDNVGLPEAETLLDVGAGDGLMLSALSTGLAKTGASSSPTSRKICWTTRRSWRRKLASRAVALSCRLPLTISPRSKMLRWAR